MPTFGGPTSAIWAAPSRRTAIESRWTALERTRVSSISAEQRLAEVGVRARSGSREAPRGGRGPRGSARGPPCRSAGVSRPGRTFDAAWAWDLSRVSLTGGTARGAQPVRLRRAARVRSRPFHRRLVLEGAAQPFRFEIVASQASRGRRPSEAVMTAAAYHASEPVSPLDDQRSQRPRARPARRSRRPTASAAPTTASAPSSGAPGRAGPRRS